MIKDYLCDHLLYSGKRKLIVFQEKGKKYRAINNSSKLIHSYKIDKQQAKTQKRCDYAFLVEQNNKFFLIELKGAHLSDAAEQLCTTLSLLKHYLTGYSIFGRIVQSRVKTPALRSSKYLKAMKLFKEHNGDLITKTSELIDNI